MRVPLLFTQAASLRVTPRRPRYPPLLPATPCICARTDPAADPTNPHIVSARRFRRRGDTASARQALERVKSEARTSHDFAIEDAHIRATELFTTSTDGATLITGARSMLSTNESLRTAAAIAAALRVTRAAAASHPAQRPAALALADQAFSLLMRSPEAPDALNAAMLALIGTCVAAGAVDTARKFITTATAQRGYHPCERARFNMLHAYASAGLVSDAAALAADLQSSGHDLTPPSVAALASAYARAGRHARALDAFDDALRNLGAAPVARCALLLRTVLGSCVTACDARGARRVHGALADAQATPPSDVVLILLRAAYAGGDGSLAEAVLFGDDGGVGVRYQRAQDDLNRMVSAASRAPALSQRARAREALRLHARARTLAPPDVGSFNVLVAALARCGALADARLVVKNDMYAARVKPNVVTYNSLLHACVVAARPYVALELWPQVRPIANQVTFNTLLNLAAECNARELLDCVLDEMRAADNVALDASAVSSLLKHYRRARDADGARRVVALLQRAQRARGAVPLPLDAVVYVSLLTLLLECGREEQAVTLFGLLVVRRAGGARAYNAMLQHFGARARDADRALALLALMKHRRVAPDATSYTIAIRAAAAARRLSLALRLLAEMTDVGLAAADTYAWTATIAACGRAARPQLALELLGHMRADGAGAPRPDVATYNAAIYAVGMNARAGWRGALRVYDALRGEKSVTPDHVTYSALASVALRHRRAVRETEVVAHVVDRLEKRIATLRSTRDEATRDAKRARARRAPQSVPAAAEIRKLAGKLRRLRWLLRNLREEGGSEKVGAKESSEVE